MTRLIHQIAKNSRVSIALRYLCSASRPGAGSLLLLWVILGNSVLVGCSSPPFSSLPFSSLPFSGRVVEPASEDQVTAVLHSDLVSMNLIYALSQLDETLPLQTTLQLNVAENEFGKTIEKRIREAGYGVQLVSADQGPNYVSYKYENSITEQGPQTSYSITLGVVTAQRQYVMNESAIYPDSPMVITGAEEKSVILNDTIFEKQSPDRSGLFSDQHEYSSEVFFVNSVGPEVVVMNSAPEVGEIAQTSFATSIRKNMHDINERSNFDDLFADYSDIKNAVLIFANDKMTIGKNNKQVIKDMAALHQVGTDIFSVVGCSHGNTNLAGGNAILATGRANRVKEALMFARVPHEDILEEGCWGGITHKEFPSRGVVLTLKRRKS